MFEKTKELVVCNVVGVKAVFIQDLWIIATCLNNFFIMTLSVFIDKICHCIKTCITFLNFVHFSTQLWCL